MQDRKTTRHTYECVVVVSPGESVPGAWVAHCLTFDVAAQANDPDEALRLAIESTQIAICDDLNAGLDPRDRRAPESEFRIVQAAMKSKQITMEEAKREPRKADGSIAVMIASCLLTFEAVRRQDDEHDILPSMIGMTARTVDRSFAQAAA